MIDRQTIEYMRLLHGSYNFIVMLFFCYQLFLGLRIRSNRQRGTITPEVIKRHRRFGPVLAVLGIIGFFAGLIIVYLDYGQLFKFPLHLIIGIVIVLSIISTYLISKKIRGADSPYRDLHFRSGLLLVSLYLIQVLIGLGILF